MASGSWMTFLTQRRSADAVARSEDLRQTMTLDARKRLYQRIIGSHPERIPVILVRAPQARLSTTPRLRRTRFLAPPDFTMRHVLAEIRKAMEQAPLGAHQALYLFVGKGVLVPPDTLISVVYERYRDEDGLLYIHYAGEDTFGQL